MLILKLIPALILWGMFIYVVLQIPYPESLIQATSTQILPFFISLFLALIFTFNIFLKNIFLSFSTSLGIIFLLILKALDLLNFVSGALIIISVGLLVSYFRKMKRRSLNPIKSDLTKK